VIGIGVILFDLAVFSATTTAIPAPKPLAITTTFSYLKGVNLYGFKGSNSTKIVISIEKNEKTTINIIPANYFQFVIWAKFGGRRA